MIDLYDLFIIRMLKLLNQGVLGALDVFYTNITAVQFLSLPLKAHTSNMSKVPCFFILSPQKSNQQKQKQQQQNTFT